MSPPVPADGLLHPVALGAVALLALNDHVLKPTFANAWTGKLSDIAGLVFFPLLLQAVIELVAKVSGKPWGPSRRVIVGAAIVSGIAFALVQVWPPATAAYRVAWGALYWPLATVGELLRGGGLAPFRPVRAWADPTDLIALPALAIAVAVGWRRASLPPEA